VHTIEKLSSAAVSSLAHLVPPNQMRKAAITMHRDLEVATAHRFIWLLHAAAASPPLPLALNLSCRWHEGCPRLHNLSTGPKYSHGTAGFRE
jgi:hypothetical protein